MTGNELSKFLSTVLRHRPGSIGIELDGQGWVSIGDLIARSSKHRRCFDRAQLMHVVATSDKKRFTVSEDGLRIRAAQGHSVEVDLGLMAVTPPAVLYHGTATRFLAAIMAEGLKPGSRQQVHLSGDAETAHKVGRRHGTPVVLTIDAAAMHAEGFAFHRADNGVWLTDHVPAAFLGP